MGESEVKGMREDVGGDTPWSSALPHSFLPPSTVLEPSPLHRPASPAPFLLSPTLSFRQLQVPRHHSGNPIPTFCQLRLRFKCPRALIFYVL